MPRPRTLGPTPPFLCNTNGGVKAILAVFRWQHYGSMTALTGERIQTSEGRPLVAAGFSPDRDPSEAAPHFAAECFFLTQLAMHYCLLPAGE